MPVYNWIQAHFADGPNFVSDATDDVSRATAQAFRNLPAPPSEGMGLAGCDYGQLSVANGAHPLACSYLRFASATHGALYVHAVLSTSGPPPALPAVQKLFEARYAAPAEGRVRELVARLELLPVAQATLALTDLFLEAGELERLRAARSRSTGAKRPGATLPWLLAVGAVGAAGFFAGRAPVATLAPVSAPPPAREVDLEQGLTRLEAAEGAAGIPLRAQLAHAQQLHEQALAQKDREIQALRERLEAALAGGEARPRAARSGAAETAAALPEVAAAAPLQVEMPAAAAASADLPERATVAADLLAVRRGPGVGYPRLSMLVAGTEVELAGAVEAGWIRIAAPDKGFVAADFLEFPSRETAPAPEPERAAAGSAAVPELNPGAFAADVREAAPAGSKTRRPAPNALDFEPS